MNRYTGGEKSIGFLCDKLFEGGVNHVKYVKPSSYNGNTLFDPYMNNTPDGEYYCYEHVENNIDQWCSNAKPLDTKILQFTRINIGRFMANDLLIADTNYYINVREVLKFQQEQIAQLTKELEDMKKKLL